MKGKKLLAVLLALAMAVPAVHMPAAEVKAAETKDDLKIWYNSPAADSYDGWEKWALPIGNSGIGGSVFGGVSRDRIQLNEKSLWSGGPAEGRNYNGGNLESQGQNGAVIKEVQRLMAEGRTSEAVNMCNQLTGVSDDAGTQGYGYYLSYGNMYLNFSGVTDSNVSNYYRELDLRTAVATVEYDYNGTHYTRESFVSYPDNVLVTHITAEGSGDIDVEISVEPDTARGNSTNGPGASSYARTWTTNVDDGKISIQGQLQDNQLKFASHTQVVADGTITDKSSTVAVADAKEVTIITSIATDYKNDYPVYRTGETATELSTRVNNYVTKATAKNYANLKADHIADFDNIFGRVDLNIGQEVPDKTTSELLQAYQKNTATDAEKRYLEVMMFQYGRYLTIEGSRETPEDDPYRATLPTNLQGMWVGANNSAWHSDYHMNVNLQMNYWPTYSTNMVECAEPLIDYVESLREPGRVTAKIYAGIESTSENPENGFMAHTQNNPFGWTCPGWNFSWGWSPAGVPWILQNCWEYYEYTGDVEYMRENIYPMLKEEAVFYDQFLVRNSKGELVSSPAYSPEQGPRTEGNTYEHSLVWQLYEDAMTAAEILGEDEELAARWAANQADLKGPIEVGDSGQIKEWYNETTFNTDENGNVMGEGFGHRHISHMLGLFPGDLIQTNDAWVEAAKVSMENRTDDTTGWAQAERICTWARLADGNRAYKVLNFLISTKIMTNLWDTHPPFQIDGNYGLTAGVAEMLLQSNMGTVNLMPAVPDTWATGNVEGLLARGNFEVDMTWEETNLTEAEILSKNGGECVVEYDTITEATVLDENGNEVEFEVVDDTKISFDTVAGKAYTITEVPAKPVEAPTNASAFYCVDTAIVTFDANVVADSYYVYESTNGVDYVKVAEITTNEYTDTNYVDGKTYKVTSVADGVEGSDMEEAITPTELAITAKIDDRDARIVYDGFSNWSQSGNSSWYQETEKYASAAGATAEFYFYGKTVRVIAMKNTDCHTFDLYIDDVLVAENVDTYASSKQLGATVVEKSVANGLHKVKLVVKQGKVSLDAFEFDYDVAATGLQIVGADKVNMNSVTTLQLEAAYLPAGAAGSGELVWSVDNEALATVDANGLLTAKKMGTVVVTVTDGTFTATKSITLTRESGAGTESVKFDQAVLAGNAIANSEMNPPDGSDGPASWAFDDQDHHWHSRWGNWGSRQPYETVTQSMSGKPSTTNPIWIQTGFDQVFYVDHITYTQRSNGFGSFKDYTVSVANLADPTATPTDADFTVVKTGTLTGATTSTIQLDTVVPATHVRITVTSVIANRCDGHVGAKNIGIYGFNADPSFVCKDDLAAAIAEAEGLTAADYTDDSWAVLAAALETAVDVNEDADATQEEINDAYLTLDAAIAALVEAGATPEPPVEEKEEVCEVFTDVTHGEWYEGAVQYVYDNGIMSGNEGLFRPTGNITRAQVVQTLYNLEGKPEVTDYSAVGTLVDVEGGQWYTDAVCWAYNTGVTTGNSDTKMFNMNTNVTRQQLATFIYRYAELKDYDVSATTDISAMVGAGDVADYAAKQVKWAVATGLIKGSESVGADGSVVYDLKPTGTATRAQVATILQRFCEANK